MDRKVTLSEVAKLAGVSLGAASKVLNGGTSKIGVGAEARKRILDAARKLNYQPNMAASILAGGSSKLIGVLIDSRAPEFMYGVLAEIELAAESVFSGKKNRSGISVTVNRTVLNKDLVETLGVKSYELVQLLLIIRYSLIIDGFSDFCLLVESGVGKFTVTVIAVEPEGIDI